MPEALLCVCGLCNCFSQLQRAVEVVWRTSGLGLGLGLVLGNGVDEFRVRVRVTWIGVVRMH